MPRTLPFDPDPAKVEAKFDKGVLHIHLPKPAVAISGFAACGNFYLASSELAFRYSSVMVFQAQLARQFDHVPLTRDTCTSVNEKGLGSVPCDKSLFGEKGGAGVKVNYPVPLHP